MDEIMQFGRRIPEYYDTMYLDGYTPYEILHAASRQLYQQHQEKKEVEQNIIIPTIRFNTVVKII